MVSSQDGDAVPVANFERDEQRNRLDAVVAAVHVVAQEEEVDELVSSAYWTLAGDAEDLAEVCELAVHVAHQHDRAVEVQHGFFGGQDGFGLLSGVYSLDDHGDVGFAGLQAAFLQAVDHLAQVFQRLDWPTHHLLIRGCCSV